MFFIMYFMSLFFMRVLFAIKKFCVRPHKALIQEENDKKILIDNLKDI